MKTCNDCRHADWKKTKTGRMHPSKEGKCTRVVGIPVLPNSFYWLGGNPTPCGGYIECDKRYPTDCVYWGQKEQARNKAGGGAEMKIEPKEHARLEKFCASECTGAIGWHKQARKECRETTMCQQCKSIYLRENITKPVEVLK